MARNVLSRVPTEIWHEILRNAILNQVIDPLEGYPSSFFEPDHVLMDTLYKELKQISHKLRCVCSGWNMFVSSLMANFISLRKHLPVSALTARTQFLREISLSEVIIGEKFTLFDYCSRSNPCDKCGLGSPPIKVSLANVFEKWGPMNVEVIGNISLEVSDLILLSRKAVPHLKSLEFWLLRDPAQSSRQSSLSSEGLSSTLSSLVYLSIHIGAGQLPNWLTSLELPALRSMELHSGPGIPNFYSWSLRSLKNMILRGPVTSDSALAWGAFPKLLCLKCPASLFITHPPPKSHPLQYLSFIITETGTFTEEAMRELGGILMARPQHRGTQGYFSWEHLITNSQRPTIMSDTGPTSVWDTIMKISALLEASGNQFVDSSGIGYTEAMKMHTSSKR
ncbi:hypothetical protein M408DRAFT_24111 [Serendipita vermifera MAFF 305830]|uniref:Uncharacterized protein n=1 Tax=Serendipita vermifera MAFF 305830 TaxID=933852 RepID=A0A0C3B9K7_SERVB|nr:hypothetical protein M408DRAFT_24111 [Serendipita vermifera MAFF 305830]